jgi:thymidylate synthase ThyX
MTKIQATVVADSVTEFGDRLTTLLVTMPRYVLAELNTHRMLSKNSASSRAIKFETNLKSVMENPFIPVAWMKDHKGMQGTEYFEGAILRPGTNDVTTDIVYLEHLWRLSMYDAIKRATDLNRLGLTKQMCNRILEPYMWHTVLVSATEWENFFALRCPQYYHYEKTFRSRKDWMRYNYHGADNDGGKLYLIPTNDVEWMKINKGQADIHMMLTAEAIWDAMNESTPKLLKAGEWHIPFGDNLDADVITGEDGNSVAKYKIHVDKIPSGETVTSIPVEGFAVEKGYYEMRKVKIATARCAQTSYTVIGEDEKELNYEKLIALHDRLLKSGHWSPFEHCARVMTQEERSRWSVYIDNEYKEGWCGNFRGFIQYRKLFANENITK